MTAHFPTPECALAYAYAISSAPIVKVSQCLAAMRQDGLAMRDHDGMSPHDHHHQAAIIIRRVSILPPMRRVLIEGMFDRYLRYPSAVALIDLVGIDRLGRQPTLEYVAEYLGEQRLSTDAEQRISTRVLSSLYGGSQMTHCRERKRIHDVLGQQFNVARGALALSLADMLDKG